MSHDDTEYDIWIEFIYERYLYSSLSLNQTWNCGWRVSVVQLGHIVIKDTREFQNLVQAIALLRFNDCNDQSSYHGNDGYSSHNAPESHKKNRILILTLDKLLNS